MTASATVTRSRPAIAFSGNLGGVFVILGVSQDVF